LWKAGEEGVKLRLVLEAALLVKQMKIYEMIRY